VASGGISAAYFFNSIMFESPMGCGHALIKQNQSEQQNEASSGQIDCDLPGGGAAIPTAPDSDEAEMWG